MQFSLQKIVTAPEKFGYMWECPDLFNMNGTEFLCVSPQGVAHEKYKFQNVYSSGYFAGTVDSEHYREWDCGFDFYGTESAAFCTDGQGCRMYRMTMRRRLRKGGSIL